MDAQYMRLQPHAVFFVDLGRGLVIQKSHTEFPELIVLFEQLNEIMN